ncbi:putative capsular polysaccharide synthesis family protein [Microbulbifer sp. ALW1]|uniref:putative capsular polysaccharide synthesis family protein n=1 Tax=Microbulbifer sp. (strain ALW1) TaxID=1516059 RepID=UPI00135A9302|nr:putative capsular polysaccharide synthesis family protein [Microbulbifer sp. ALW1]
MRIFKRLTSTYKKLANEESILVYQMGKVGSTSLERSIPGAVQLHSLYGRPPCHLHEKKLRESLIGNLWLKFRDAFTRFAINRRKKIRIITLIRNPLDRNVSMFFQDLLFWGRDYVDQHRPDTREEGEIFLVEAFHKAFDHFYFDTWFDEEIKRFTGIDVFEYANSESGHIRIQQGRFDILLLKTEQLNTPQAREAMADFCKSEVKLSGENKGENKWYAEAYTRVKGIIASDREYRAQIQSTRTYRHFYLE